MSESTTEKRGVLETILLIIGVILFIVIGYWLLGAAWSLLSAFFLPIVAGTVMYFVGKRKGRKEALNPL